MATAKSEQRRGRGRPAIYVGETEQKIVSLLKKVGNASVTRKILSGKGGNLKSFAEQRKAAGFEKPVRISMPTLLNLAERNNVALQVGRPATKVA